MHSLCGRGGSINSHAGNVVFRQWITERKESYNLADTKNDKSRVANDIMLKVRSLRPPGRFLHKIPDKSSGGSNDLDENGYWVEVDDIKAMAKISQALREGAPAFRAAHGKSKTSKPRKSSPPKRRNSLPEAKPYTKRRKTRSATRSLETSPEQKSMAIMPPPIGMDVSPPYLDDDMGEPMPPLDPDPHLDVGDFETLFNHNNHHNNKYRQNNNNHFAFGQLGTSNRFGQYSTLNSHPLVPMGDYHASISDVANAIPPTPEAAKKQRAMTITTPILLPVPDTPPEVPPYSLHHDHLDPYSFLSPASLSHASGMHSPRKSNDNVNGEMKAHAKSTMVFHRGHSLSFSEGENHEVGEFTNPFENEDQIMGILKSNHNHRNGNHNSGNHTRHQSEGEPYVKQPSALHMWENSNVNVPTEPSPHVTPPPRGFSFGNIGSIPNMSFLRSRKSSASSNASSKEVGMFGNSKVSKEATKPSGNNNTRGNTFAGNFIF